VEARKEGEERIDPAKNCSQEPRREGTELLLRVGGKKKGIEKKRIIGDRKSGGVQNYGVLSILHLPRVVER